ncbi:MAG: IclR family transcriptional regulator [Dichotomicrobium sp.]
MTGSILKTFDVLEVFGRKWKPLTLSELCRETGRPKSSLHRILATLVEAGVVEHTEGGEYRLTLKLWRIGVQALTEIDVMQVARPHLERLSRAADETVHLAVLEEGGGVVYLAKVESPRSIRVQTQVGKVSPSWCTATGRAILAFTPDIRDAVLAQPKEKRAPGTITDPEKLRDILDEVAEKQYAIAQGENHPEMGGIAAPIRNHSGKVVASCGIAIPIFRMDDKLVERTTPMVLDAAAQISRELGYLPFPSQDQADRIISAHG